MKNCISVNIGCSGFSYRDWIGVFYPQGLNSSDFITFYEKFFNIVEINYSFYSMPNSSTMENFVNKTKRLKFAVKAYRIFTHNRKYSRSDRDKFLKSCEPLLESERFIAFLFQFPQSFYYSLENMEYIKRLSESFEGYPKVLEVRSRSFARAEFFEEVESLGFSLVNIDAPKVKGIIVGPWKSIGEINYIRLHGRNAEKWFNSEDSYERYDYLYSTEEITWIGNKIKRLCSGKETYVFFNNHYRGKSLLNALQLKEFFGEKVKIPAALKGLFSTTLWE